MPSPQDHAEFLKQGGSLADLIEGLEPVLTSEEDEVRGTAVHDLVQVTSEYPACFRTTAEVNTVATFLTDKLTDRACVSAALEGCLTLVRFHESRSAETSGTRLDLDVGVAERIEQTLLRELPIKGLSHDNRRRCLQLLLALTQVFGRQLVARGVRLVDDVTQAVDGERDPRCLLVAFELIQATAALYSAHFPAALEPAAEELCDVVACYFPITFRLPPNAAHGITRDILAAALEPVLSSTPLFAQFVVPLLLDKLSSSLWQAKVDSMSAIAACLESWGPSAVAVELPRVWWALREELTDPTTPDSGEGGSTAAAAAECLRRCLAARDKTPPQHGAPPRQTLLGQLLEDEHVADVPQWLAESSSAGESTTTARRFAVANEILAAAAGATTATFSALMQRLHPSLLSHIDSGQEAAAGLALSSSLALFKGAAEGAAGPWAKDGHLQSPSSEFETALSGWGSSLSAVLLQQLGSGAAAASPASAKVALLRVRLLAQLASFPPGVPQPLPAERLGGAVAMLAAVVVDESATAEVAHEAAVGIATIAGAGQADVVESSVLPIVMTAVAAPQQQSSTRQAAPLACLVAVARASQQLRPAVFDRLIKAALEALAASLARDAAKLRTAESLLTALAEQIIPACPHPFQGPEARAAAALSLGLISAAPDLPQGDDSSGILPRAAAAAQISTAGCGGEEQDGIASAAAKAVLEAAALAGQHESAGPIRNWVGVPAAALVALRPGVGLASGPNAALDCLRALLKAAILADSDWASDVAMAAAAAAILKWPSGAAETAVSVDEAVGAALDETVLPQIQLQLAKEGPQRRLRAVRLLGWIGKGLAMRGHERSAVPLEVAAAYLESASLDLAGAEEEEAGEGSEWGQEEVFDAAEAREMAEVFATVIGPGEGMARLDQGVHAVGRILWQQKAFEKAAAELEAKLEEGEAFLGAPPAPLLLALAHLTGACPPRVVAGSLPRLLPRLLAALQALASGPLQDGGALTAALAALEHALEQESGREVLQDQLDALIAALLLDVRFEADVRVRIGALTCLKSAARLPYDRLHAHRRPVLTALAAAVDDPKRAVRQHAAQARRVWMPTLL